MSVFSPLIVDEQNSVMARHGAAPLQVRALSTSRMTFLRACRCMIHTSIPGSAEHTSCSTISRAECLAGG